jgi:hypothetical protein
MIPGSPLDGGRLLRASFDLASGSAQINWPAELVPGLSAFFGGGDLNRLRFIGQARARHAHPGPGLQRGGCDPG